MAEQRNGEGLSGKGNPGVRRARDEDNDVALVRRWLREAIDESGWKHEAVAKAMREKSGLAITGPYLSKLLAVSGERKTVTAAHICALPDVIEAIYARKYAEHFGLLVVAPVDEVTARRHLVSGLLFGLGPRLPARAGRPLKAALEQDRDDEEKKDIA